MTTAVPPSGGSFIAKPGPTPVIKLPTQKAEVDKLYTLADIDPIGPFNGIFYGAPGSGKTVTAATLPPPFRWLDLDGGLKSLRWAFKAGITSLTKLEDVVGYRPIEHMEGQYPNLPAAFDKATDMLDHWIHKDKDNWQTLVIDSATEWNTLAIYKGLHLNGVYPKKDRPLSRSDEVNEQAKAMLVVGEQDYKSGMGLLQGTVDETIAECGAQGKNIVLICHEWTETESDKEGRERVTKYLPLLTGQLRTRIVKSFQDVWHLELFNGKQVKAQMFEDPRHIAKTRWGNIPKIDEVADYREMLKKVKEFHGIK